MMISIAALLRTHLTGGADDRGASLVEYVLLVALIAVACLTAVAYLGSSLDSEYSRIGSTVATP